MKQNIFEHTPEASKMGGQGLCLPSIDKGHLPIHCNVNRNDHTDCLTVSLSVLKDLESSLD